MAPFQEKSSRDYSPADSSVRPGLADLFPPAPEPATELARYRLLAPCAGARVSPVCIGGMSLGDQWTGFMGKAVSPDAAMELLDAYYEMGGNFVDTSGNYQDEQSERIIGEWMEKRGNRDEMVIATKYTTLPLHRKDAKFPGLTVNYAGNHRKNLLISVESSLRKLKTTYIDLLFIHWWDHSTSIPEIMQSLNELVRQGKVMYLGISDTPAWIVSQANEYARQNGMAQFAVYQGLWSIADRAIERDILPMCRHNGMSLMPWGVLGSGRFKRASDPRSRWSLGAYGSVVDEDKVSKALEEVADEHGENVPLTAVALAWARQTMFDCYPILGGASIDHLRQNVDALKITLTPEQMRKLNEASPFDPGFPTGVFGKDPRGLPGGVPEGALLNSTGHIVFNTWA